MIIGINGFKGVGKDEAANYLVSRYGFEKASFAALLKESVAALFEINQAEIEWFKNDPAVRVTISKEGDMGEDVFTQLTFRKFLQRYGTEAHRDIFGQEFWVENLMKTLDLDKNYVIPDARFDNELRAVKFCGGFNWCIERPGYEGEDHASEVAPHPDLIDYYISNHGSISVLREQLDQARNKARRELGEPTFRL